MSSHFDPSAKLFSDHNDPRLAPPRRADPLTIIAFLLGAASPLAVIGQTYWAITGISLLGCALILVRLGKRTEPTPGRALAIAGLVIAIVVVTFAPTSFYLRRGRISKQAEAIGQEWLTAIVDNKAYMALAAMDDPENRIVNEQLEKFYRDKEVDRNAYQQFVNRELIRTLITLDGSARVRFYGTEEVLRKDDVDIITNVFAVTYLADDSTRKTFFVRLVVQRSFRLDKITGFWQVTRYQGGVRPRI